jgi:hypothetical protein
MTDIFIKSPICAICGSKDVYKINKHVYYLIDCKDCEHAYALIEEKSIKKFTKKESFENNFCPYSTIMKSLHNEEFKIQLAYGNFNNPLCHYFSEKSLKRFLSNLGIGFKLEINDKIATFTILLRCHHQQENR